MTKEEAASRHYDMHRQYFREVLQGVRKVMDQHYRLHQISIRPIGSGGSRLSIPVRIAGVDERGQKACYFGKILGNSDLMTARMIQFLKNIQLEIYTGEPIFAFAKSAEDMARHQYQTLRAIHEIGIPTSKPHGYHPIDGALWLLVTEFLDARPITSVGEVKPADIDTVFGYLRKMHDRGIFHGDIKPDNIMIGDKVYILDVGHFLEDVSKTKKMAYDLACQIVCFLGFRPPEEIVRIAARHYSLKEMREAAAYLDLIQRRPDISLTDEAKNGLLRLMTA